MAASLAQQVQLHPSPRRIIVYQILPVKSGKGIEHRGNPHFIRSSIQKRRPRERRIRVVARLRVAPLGQDPQPPAQSGQKRPEHAPEVLAQAERLRRRLSQTCSRTRANYAATRRRFLWRAARRDISCILPRSPPFGHSLPRKSGFPMRARVPKNPGLFTSDRAMALFTR